MIVCLPAQQRYNTKPLITVFVFHSCISICNAILILIALISFFPMRLLFVTFYESNPDVMKSTVTTVSDFVLNTTLLYWMKRAINMTCTCIDEMKYGKVLVQFMCER